MREKNGNAQQIPIAFMPPTVSWYYTESKAVEMRTEFKYID